MRFLSFAWRWRCALPRQDAPTVDAATRNTVIEAAIASLAENYVFPDTAKKMADAVRDRRARGDYDSVTDGAEFARLLTEHFQAVSHDRHLRVSFDASGFSAGHDGAPSIEEQTRVRRELVSTNCGFNKAERLDGNIGYLEFRFFGPVDDCGETASAAMSFLAGTDALVVDLRENGGGAPAMIAHISSYLFDTPTHLNDIWERRTNATREFWTEATVSGKRFGGRKPVYVLTATRTFSGAEEFSYNLKILKRATIVGEVTGGGAHPVAPHRIHRHFMIGVPFARAINPITKTNWEGTGVEPDVAVPAAQALEAALKLARVSVDRK